MDNQVLKKVISSRQTWVIALMFAVNGITAVREFIPSGLLPVVDALLGLAAIYFRVKPRQSFSQ